MTQHSLDGGITEWPTHRRTPPETRVYAVGDIHGRSDLLDAMLDMITADAADAPARRVLVFLGDYIDRGPDPRGVIERLLSPPAGFETVTLRGNHEDMMVGFLKGAGHGGSWMLNGAQTTLASYDVALGPRLGDRLAANLPPGHQAFLDNLSLYHREGDFLFVHAGLRPGYPVERQDPDDLVWIRRPFLTSDDDLGLTVVHGHSITWVPEVRRNRIGIDTGAFHTGVLTCLVAEGETLRFLQT